MPQRRSLVMHDQTGTAAGADDEARQQRGPLTGDTHRLRPCTVGLQAGDIGLILLPANVRRAVVRHEGQPITLCWLVTSSALESDRQSRGQSPGTQGLGAL